MDLKKYAILSGIALLILLMSAEMNGQEVPYQPVSSRMFTPFIYNPAIAGSKDFSSIDYSISRYKKTNSHLLSGNFRVPRSDWKYYTSTRTTQFSGFGLGGYVFDDYKNSWRNSGIGAAVAYHFQLDKEAVSFLSVGLAGKAISSMPAVPTDSVSDVSRLLTDADAGIYYYNPAFYVGISATNLFNQNISSDSTHSAPYKKEFFINAGYKIVLSRSGNIILEPSIIMNPDDKFSRSLSEMLKPSLRLYAGNFCIGTYLNESGKIPFFIQYKYSKAYIAAFFELPGKSAFYKQPVRTEFALGLNLSAFRKGNYKRNHW